MKIGIYGGTFDPPHIGHEAAASAAASALGLDKLLVIPSFVPPHKLLPADAPDAATRMELTRLTMEGLPCAEVSDVELARGGKSYTIDTLTEIGKEYPGAELFLLVGTDMLLSFESWRSFEEILKRCTLAAFTRRSGDEREVLRFSEVLRQKYGAKVVFVPHEAIEISSSDIRRLLQKRRGTEYLTDGVYAYITRRRLYGARLNFDWLRVRAYAMLEPKRVPHVAGCEAEAVRLAERWGADEDLAREAAILHDITKKEDLAGQLHLCEKYGIIADSDERADRKLLHAKTAAAIAGEEFGCCGDVCGAIEWHTTGRENMSLLEKIIYLADYIEPTRDFPGLAELRRLAYEDLDRALLMGFEMSLEDMKGRGIVPHGRTLRAAEWIRETLQDRE